MKNCLIGAVATTVAAVSLSANAALVQVRDAPGGEYSNGNPGGPLLAGTGSALEGTTENGSWGPLYVGTFALEADYGSGWTPLITYCVQPNQGFGFGDYPDDQVGLTYETTSLTDMGFTALQADYVQILWANAFDESQTSPEKAAAFQSALWELTEDASIDLHAGNFRLNDGVAFTSQVISIAQTWLDNIVGGEWTESVHLIGLTHPESQDFITVVPAPGAMAVLAMAAFAQRRRRA